MEKDYKEFKLHSFKQSVEGVLIERAVKPSMKIIYDKGLFDNYDNADEILKTFLFVQRRRPYLEELNDDDCVTHCYFS